MSTTTAIVTEEYIRQKCSSSPELEATHVECTVEKTGDGCDGGAKVQLLVVSPKFDTVYKSLIQRHKIINNVFEQELKSGAIHALTIKAKTPSQYEPSSSQSS